MAALDSPQFTDRNYAEMEVLRDTFQQLFPNEYHYVVEYEKNGVKDLPQSKIKVLFEETKKLNNIDYTLVVLNNGQIFTNTLETTEINSGNLRINDTYQKTQDFTVGDIGHYVTFTVTYTVYLKGYDLIDSYTTSGSGFYLYPTSYRFKKEEDSSGSAYVAYINCPMTIDGSGSPFYDLGVAVGHDQAKGLCQPSNGWDLFLYALLYAFMS